MDQIRFIVEKAEEGGYNARAESESIFTQADTLSQLKRNIEEAIECHFDVGFLPVFTLKFAAGI